MKSRLQTVSTLETQLDYAIHAQQNNVIYCYFYFTLQEAVIADLRRQLDAATSDHLSLSYSASLPLAAVAELSEEEESYTTLHDQLDQLHLWLSRLTTLLFNSPLSDDIPRDCRRIDAWCRAAVRRQSDPQRSVLEAPYMALIQAEIAELFGLIEGAEAAPKPLKQLHRMQKTVRHALQHTHAQNLHELEEDRGEMEVSWDEMYSVFRGEFVGEMGKCDVGTSYRGNEGNGGGGRKEGGFIAGNMC